MRPVNTDRSYRGFSLLSWGHIAYSSTPTWGTLWCRGRVESAPRPMRAAQEFTCADSNRDLRWLAEVVFAGLSPLSACVDSSHVFEIWFVLCMRGCRHGLASRFISLAYKRKLKLRGLWVMFTHHQRSYFLSIKCLVNERTSKESHHKHLQLVPRKFTLWLSYSLIFLCKA